MPKIVVQEEKEFSVLPENSIVYLKIEKVEQVDVPSRQGGTWEKLEFTFKCLGIQVLGDDGDINDYEDVITSTMYGSVSARLTVSPENRLRQWAEAILGVELGLGYELDTDLFLNRQVRGVTIQYDKKIRDRSGNPYKGHKIDSLLPKAGSTPQTQTYQQPQQGWSNGQTGQQQGWSNGQQNRQQAANAAANPFAGSGISAGQDDMPPF